MRKLAVSFLTLTSLTACTQGDELGSNWSFELPEDVVSDNEQYARFGQQIGDTDLDGLATAEPILPNPEPGFTDSASQQRPPMPQPESLPETGPSDLSIDELVEFTYPQRGPRPNPLAQVRFSPVETHASNRYIERIMGAADSSRKSRPVDVSMVVPAVSPARLSEPAYRSPVFQPPFDGAIGGPAMPAAQPVAAIEQLPPPPAFSTDLGLEVPVSPDAVTPDDLGHAEWERTTLDEVTVTAS
ncbi:MAG: hypothetical protein AAFY78_13175 [Cyanobacteria bacterium J06648_16]